MAESSQMIVRGVVDEVKIEDQYNEPGTGVIWVLASLDMDAVRKKQDALVASVFQILERAITRINAHVKTNKVLDQPAMLELVGVLAQVKRLGLSRLGRKVRDRWMPTYSSYRRLLERLAECVQVKAAVYRQGEERLDAATCPKIMDGTRVELNFGCKMLPLTNARLKVDISGGLTGMPGRLETDGKGRVELGMGQVFGQGKVKVGFVNDLDQVEGAQWLRMMEPSHRGTICFKASRPARIKVKILGAKGSDKTQILDALKAFVARKWGAMIVSGGAPLNASVRLDQGNVSDAMGKYVVPLKISMVVNGEEGKMYERKSRVGSVAASPKKARAQALKNLLQTIGRW